MFLLNSLQLYVAVCYKCECTYRVIGGSRSSLLINRSTDVYRSTRSTLVGKSRKHDKIILIDFDDI
jgi:hypothetical protein